MNRIDRLFGILLLLQTRHKLRAEDIAKKFEITERTVYRDMSALMQLGIPILSQAGEGYTLMEGYFLPPLVFSPEEAKALFLGVKMLQSSGNLVSSSQSAAEKLKAALPQRLYKSIAPLVDSIDFFSETGRFNLENPHLLSLQKAIQEKRVLQLNYLGWGQEETTERKIEPFRLTYGNGTWYLGAYCRLRQGIRSFRLERIGSLRLLDEKFETEHTPSPIDAPNLEIKIRFPKAMLRWVQERQHYGFVDELEEQDSSIYLYRLHDLSEIKAWLLGWGANVEVLEPLELRQIIREEAQKWLNRY